MCSWTLYTEYVTYFNSVINRAVRRVTSWSCSMSFSKTTGCKRLYRCGKLQSKQIINTFNAYLQRKHTRGSRTGGFISRELLCFSYCISESSCCDDRAQMVVALGLKAVKASSLNGSSFDLGTQRGIICTGREGVQFYSVSGFNRSVQV